MAAAKSVDVKFNLAPVVEAKVKAGEKFPDVELLEGSAMTKVQTGVLFGAAKKAVIFGVPGAFTPGCSKTHLPGYVKDFKSLSEKGVDLIVCVSVNDSFVMEAWGEAHGATGKVRMLADPVGTLTKALGLETMKPPLGGLRMRRFSALVESGTITKINVEPDGVPMACSLSNTMLAQL